MEKNEIGNVRPIVGTSTALNTQPGQGATKAMPKGNDNPGDTKPPMAKEEHVEIP